MIRTALPCLAAAGALALALAAPAAAQTPLEVLREAARRAGPDAASLRSLTTTMTAGTETRVVHLEREGEDWVTYGTPVANDASFPDISFVDGLIVLATLLPDVAEEDVPGISMVEGAGPVAGRAAFVLRIPTDDGMAVDLAVDRETYGVLGASIVGTTEDGSPMSIQVELHDPRPVPGAIPVAYRRVVRLKNFLALAGLSREQAEGMTTQLEAMVRLLPADEGADQRELVRMLREALSTGDVTFTANVTGVAVNRPRPEGLVPLDG